jgi:perosamine synthetase
MSVFIGSIPNTQKDDIALANSILNGKVTKEGWIGLLEDEFEKSFNKKAFLFNRGRDSLYFFLKLLNLKESDEVITQAFTCVAVVAPILWAGAKPIFADIDSKTFNIDIPQLKKKINEKTRVIIVQHTFGNLANIEDIRKLVEEENSKREESRKISIIEDCAHIFSKNLSNYEIGRFSDAFFFSFSQDKSISSTQGGLLFLNNNRLGKEADREYKLLNKPSEKEAKYFAKYIILWDRIKRNYFKTIIPFTKITLGRVLLIVYRTLGLIRKQADNSTIYNSKIERMSNIQASLLLIQLEKSERLNRHRRDIVKFYNTSLKCEFKFGANNNILLRYPILISNRNFIKSELSKVGIIVGIWYSTPVFPFSSVEQLKKCNYEMGSCPNAEELGKYILNLPTNIEVSEKEVEKIVSIVNDLAQPVRI